MSKTVESGSAYLPASSSVSPPRSIWDASLLEHLLRTVAIFFTLYTVFLLALTYEPFQRTVVYLHHVKWPLFPKYSHPEVYGLAPNRVRNFHIDTSDGARLGTWHVLPSGISDQFAWNEDISESVFDDALRNPSHPVMLYFHGNAGMRITGHRIPLARHMSAAGMGMNYVAIDYRGFADSSKIPPSEAGLAEDAYAAWQWLVRDKGVPPEQIIVAGESLGTGVATSLVGRRLVTEGIKPRALVLTAPFTSIPSLLLTYKIGTLIPILQPLLYFPGVKDYLLSFLKTKFDTLSIFKDVNCPILLIHAQNDRDVPFTHSRTLFDEVAASEADETSAEVSIERQELADFGTLSSFARSAKRDPITGKSPVIMHLEAKYGGHSDVGYSEIALRTIRSIAANGWR